MSSSPPKETNRVGSTKASKEKISQCDISRNTANAAHCGKAGVTEDTYSR